MNFKLWLENFDWVKEINSQLPNWELDLPKITKKGKVIVLEMKKNPVHLRLDDGTNLYLTIDEFRRINKQPKIGDTLSVEFLNTREPNMQISRIICH